MNRIRRNSTLSVATRYTALAAAVLAATACADDVPDHSDSPAVEQISTNSLVIGESLMFYGRNFLGGLDENGEINGETHIRFTGVYEADDGSTEEVDLTIKPFFDGAVKDGADDEYVLRWNRFGPFHNPFHSADRPGVFRGEIVAVTTDKQGLTTEDPAPGSVALEVGPSIVIDEFQPLDADCGAPALRALAGIPYKMRVRTVGLKAVKFTYTFHRINGVETAVSWTHQDFGGAVDGDSVGYPIAEGGVEGQYIVFNPLDEREQFYVTHVEIVAEDAAGNYVETVLPISVHRPVEVVYNSKPEVAEIYNAVPVSGCIPGSLGTGVSYNETETETRQTAVNMSISQNFNRSQGVTNSESFREGISEGESTSRTLGGSESESENIAETTGLTYSNSEQNSVNLSTSDGETWGFNSSNTNSNDETRERMEEDFGEVSGSVAVGAKGEVGVPLVANGEVSSTVTVGGRTGGREGSREGTRIGRSNTEGYSSGGSRNSSRSFGSATSNSMSESVSGTYALTSSRTRSQSDTESRNRSRTYDFSQSGSKSNVISEGMSEAEGRTWVSTESRQVGQGYGARIPSGAFGMFYRQTTRIVTRADVISYDLCGVGTHMGEMQFNEWEWAPDLVLGSSCEEVFNKTNLPPAECRVPPCGG
jgi:hypothetical protein